MIFVEGVGYTPGAPGMDDPGAGIWWAPYSSPRHIPGTYQPQAHTRHTHAVAHSRAQIAQARVRREGGRVRVRVRVIGLGFRVRV